MNVGYMGLKKLLDLEADTIKAALYTNSLASQSSSGAESKASSPFTSNELATGNGYTSGGKALTTPDLNIATAGKVIFTDSGSTTISWAATGTNETFTARGLVLWDDTPTSGPADPVLACENFGADKTVLEGNFVYTIHQTNGLFYLSYPVV